MDEPDNVPLPTLDELRDSAPKLTDADLLAWGRDWELAQREPLKPGEEIRLGDPRILEQYLRRANDGLALLLQREQTRKQTRWPTAWRHG